MKSKCRDQSVHTCNTAKTCQCDYSIGNVQDLNSKQRRPGTDCTSDCFGLHCMQEVLRRFSRFPVHLPTYLMLGRDNLYKTQGKSADNKLMAFFLFFFSMKIGYDISWKLSPKEYFAWNVKVFSGKKKKKKSKCSLLKYPACIVINKSAIPEEDMFKINCTLRERMFQINCTLIDKLHRGRRQIAVNTYGTDIPPLHSLLWIRCFSFISIDFFTVLYFLISESICCFFFCFFLIRWGFTAQSIH